MVGDDDMRESEGYGSAAGGPSAFREMEKKYQLHFDQVMKYSRGKLRGKRGKFVERETDFSDVVDFAVMRDDARKRDDNGIRCQVLAGKGGSDFLPSDSDALVVYTMERHPGFYFIPNMLDDKAQLELATSILTEYIDPPANSNHTKRYSHFEGLWEASKDTGLFLSSDDHGNTWSRNRTGASAAMLLEKLRWVTLGPQFNWTERRYINDAKVRQLPDRLKCQAEEAVSQLGIHSDTFVEYSADAALLNFYGVKDTLGGHRDDAEEDLSQPIVSMSIGCDAIFLLGYETKEGAPTPMLLRSGDTVVLAGPARRCYHGIPRILSSSNVTTRPISDERSPNDGAVERYLSNHRINVSIRMVRAGVTSDACT
eukprot:CAMPEP_0198246660 /NCGR_PEP_ID=MMETSP1446-20131203/46086_1 /TAXON_ID=1461542 ORGANISM="Unidentified sp, Strain CCMP2111" /NCGR_SAMPLE_ID=MMETSP1446 /ASSEMBLY_ACC=CAM_ASM_001112 /LENGTH=368 /DNA_ID=CAMNT_0043930983 /DNA_START=270 /DNA_END=1376 /DNA_ORIENTATION=-